MLLFGDNILLVKVVSEMAFADELIISISSEEKINKYDLFIEHPHKFVVDKFDISGAFTGLLSAVSEAEGGLIAIAPCDTPFVTRELYEVLIKSSKGYDGAVPKLGKFWEPLIAVYKKKPLYKYLEENIEMKNIRLSGICNALNINEVDYNIFRKENIAEYSFLNINTQEDLEKALRIYKTIQNI